MFTRENYLNGSCDHKTYYDQFVTGSLVKYVGDNIGVTKIRSSKCKNFSDIPLGVWDLLIVKPFININTWIEAEGGLVNNEYSWSMCDRCCIAKAAADRIRDN